MPLQSRFEIRRLLIVVASVALSGCYLRGAPHANAGGTVSSRKTIVVGRVELVPPLRPDEQRVGLQGWMRGKVFLLYDKSSHPVDPGEGMLSLAWAIHARQGEPFAVKVPRTRLHILQTRIALRYVYVRNHLTWLALPGGVIDISPEDTAVYIGTIRFHRAGLAHLEQVEVVDHFESERAAFEKKYRVELRKSLFQPR